MPQLVYMPAPSVSSTTSASLSTGAKAGIGTGVTLVVILFSIGFLLLYKRRKKSRVDTLPKPEAQEAYAKPELSADEKPRSELPGSYVPTSELSNKTQAPCQSHATMAEMDGAGVVETLTLPQPATIPRKPVPKTNDGSG